MQGEAALETSVTTRGADTQNLTYKNHTISMKKHVLTTPSLTPSDARQGRERLDDNNWNEPEDPQSTEDSDNRLSSIMWKHRGKVGGLLGSALAAGLYHNRRTRQTAMLQEQHMQLQPLRDDLRHVGNQVRQKLLETYYDVLDLRQDLQDSPTPPSPRNDNNKYRNTVANIMSMWLITNAMNKVMDSVTDSVTDKLRKLGELGKLGKFGEWVADYLPEPVKDTTERPF